MVRGAPGVVTVRVLVSLTRGYGLGDAVQMSAVLRHVKKYRPEWTVDFQAEPGRESVGRGHCANIFCYGQQPDVRYGAEVQIVLYDTFANWHDRPNTRVTSCLHEKFGLEWDSECGRYQVLVRPETRELARRLIPRNSVAIHYSGDSAKHKKDLTVEQAQEICEQVKKFGFSPLILDWRIDPLSINIKGVRSLGFDPILGRDAEVQCAVLSECIAFVGVDSGPSKCASATDTPSLVCWTGHHPAPFHDPAPNTTHLVPAGYHGLEPVCSDPGVVKWFEVNHRVRVYSNSLVREVGSWLSETLPRSRRG